MLKIFENFSIKTKVYVSYGLILMLTIGISLVGIYSLNHAIKDFSSFSLESNRVSAILEVDRDVMELQKNIVLYSYSGYGSVAERVDALLIKVLGDIDRIESLMSTAESKDLVVRMRESLLSYKNAFAKVIKEREVRAKLLRVNITGDVARILKHTEKKNNEENIRSLVFKTQNLLFRYIEELDYTSISTALDLFNSSNELELLSKGSELEVAIRVYRENLLGVAQLTRAYLYLVSVVMAGEAHEFQYLSSLLRTSILQKSENIQASLSASVNNSQTILLLTVLLTLLLGGWISWATVKSVNQPISMITSTFKLLSEGYQVSEVPGERRKDEIGVLAKAASVFRQKNEDTNRLVGELDENKKKLERSNNELSQFAYRTSHDLKSPLVSIRGMAGVMEEDLQDGNYDEVGESLKKIKKNCLKLEYLVNDILSLARADISLEQEILNFTEILDDIKDRVQWMADEKSVSVYIESRTDREFKGQKARVVQIIENLVTNSIKYSDSKKSESFVKVCVASSNEGVVVEVEDNGLGIAEEFHSRVFEMFQRFLPSVASGSGLGMSILKKHIDYMKGTVEFSSSSNGTKFQVYLPDSNAGQSNA